MKALCWMGKGRITVEDVPEPRILNPSDAIVRITAAAICGSDLHLVNGFVDGMAKGDILGHEFMGEVVEVGSAVRKLKVGDRVVVPFAIACGQCFYCRKQQYSLCENSNPNALLGEKAWGHAACGAFGYSHLTGGYAGGQAEYVRVPFADVGPLKVPDGMSDEQVLFLGDIFPTGWMAAEQCDIQPGDTIAVWGCGPVGQFAIRSCFLLGAGRVIAIDRVPERLEMARRQPGVETIDFDAVDDLEDVLRAMTGGRGPDACIDAVGMEAHGHGVVGAVDRAKQKLKVQSDRPNALRGAIRACRNGGTVSVPGVYSGFVDMFPMGSVMNRSLTIKTGQTHVQRYMKPLLGRIEKGEIDPSFVITHRMALDDAPHGYRMFNDKDDGCIKVVLRPGGTALMHG
jgi:threonine dehydrogenase-like Zn-dependent dehydrogenase